MLFEFNRFSSLLLVFVVHGLVYAFLLFRRSIRNNSTSDRWLALFLILCVLYIAPWMLGFAGWYDTQPYRDLLFYIPMQHLFFIGPLIFFYVQSLLNPSFRFGRKEWLHLVPGFLYLLFCVVMVITDKVALHRYYFLASGLDPDFDTWYQVTGFLSMLTYFILSLRYYTMYRKLIVQVISYADAVLFRWVQLFLRAFLMMLLFRLIFYVTDFFIDRDYGDTWWYFLCFALIAYYIAITGYANAVEARVAFRGGWFAKEPLLLLPVPGSIEEQGNPVIIELDPLPAAEGIPDETLEDWKQRILKLLSVDKLYGDPDLSLAQLSQTLQSNPSFISKIINRGFAMNFNDLVNSFRVDAVKNLLGQGEHRKQTLLGIALECGFNSKATFNRAFKKATGMTPKEYTERLT